MKDFQSIVECSAMGILVIGRDEAILYANSAAAEMFGQAPEALIGNPLGLPVQSRRTTEIEVHRRDGQSGIAELLASRITWRGESAILVTLHDVTERRANEENLAFAREKAFEASRAKSEFLARMSHEIRTPLNSVLGMAELLAEAPLNEEQQRFLDILRRSGSSLLEVINDILDISKIESGEIRIDATEFKLREFLENTFEAQAARAFGKEIDLICDIADDCPALFVADQTRLKQVLTNLLGNALKFTESGTIILEARREAESLRLTVRDTGPGIPRSRFDLIFEPFAQASGETTRKYGGTGLGLAIAKRFAAMMGGRIELESVEGQGSAFHVVLPLTSEADARGEETLAPEHGLFTGVNIHVALARPEEQKIITRILVSQGACVSHASDLGDWATGQASRDIPGFGALITDEKTWEAHSETLSRLAPPLALSGKTIFLVPLHYIRRDRPSPREITQNHYLFKPIKKDELIAAICRILGRSPAVVVSPEIKGPLALHPDDVPREILLVDDVADNRLLIQAFLRDTPAKLTLAQNGQEAVEWLAKKTFDLVLMDMQMPVMDGFEATARIRDFERESGRKRTVIVALTAYALAEEYDRIMAAGCDGVLTKPIRKKTLLKAIQESS